MIKIKSIKGFENVLDIYYITKDGKVFSGKTNDFMKLGDNGRGYKNVSLKLDGVRKWKKAYVHRLVASAYIGEIKEGMEVDHVDGCKSNNELSNLRIVTRLENIRNENTISKNKRDKEVYVYSFEGIFLSKERTLSEASIKYLGYRETKSLNKRSGDYFFFDRKVSREEILKVNNNSLKKVVKMVNIKSGEIKIFPTKAKAAKFLKVSMNITDAINKKWVCDSKYRFYNYDFNTIDSLNLQEMNCKK